MNQGCSLIAGLLLFFFLLPSLWPVLLLLAVLFYFMRWAGSVRAQRAHSSGEQFERTQNGRQFGTEDAEWINVEDLIGEFYRMFEQAQRQAQSQQGGTYGDYGRSYNRGTGYGSRGSQQGSYDGFGSGNFMSDAQMYELLGVTPGCTDDELKSAYRKKVLQYHPDRVRQFPEARQKQAAEQFKKVTAAYETLSRRRGM